MTQGLLFTIARWLVALLFLYSGVSKTTHFASTKAMMVQYGFPLATCALVGAIGIEIGGGVLLGAGVLVRPVTVTLGLYVIAASLMILGQQLWDPTLRMNALNHLAKNLAVIGALVQLYAHLW